MTLQRERLIDKSENDALLDALFAYLRHATKYTTGTDELGSRCFTLALALTSSVLMLRERLGPPNPRIAERAKEWSEVLGDVRNHLDIRDEPTVSS
jgi:hypothetical protein